MEQMLRVTQTGSIIGRTQDQRATVRSLGLRRIRHTVLQPDRPAIRGMIGKVAHLVTFEPISTEEAEAFQAALEASQAPRPAPSGPRAKDVARGAWRAKEEVKRAAHAERIDRGATEAAAQAKARTSAAAAQAADAAEPVESAEPVEADGSAEVKAPAKKAPAKKAATKKAATEATAEETSDAPEKKPAAKKAPAKKAAAKKSTAKKSEG